MGPDRAAGALDTGIPEDPVTGSLNAVIAQWLQPDGLLPAEHVASQGAALAQAGRVHRGDRAALRRTGPWSGSLRRTESAVPPTETS